MGFDALFKGTLTLGGPEEGVDELKQTHSLRIRKDNTFTSIPKDDKLLRNGVVIPVNDLFGELPANNLENLESLLLDSKVARIGIVGIEGIGKTILMKHLHNRALKWFDGAFWVTFPKPFNFSIKHLQDAVAEAIKCDLSDADESDLLLRARLLSHAFADLGRVVIFLDAVPEPEPEPEDRFSLEEVGIPVPTSCGDSASKLVLTTNSPLVCEMLDCGALLQLSPLPEEEAFRLFMYKAGIDQQPVPQVVEIARLLAKHCYGVPGKIVATATSMCGIDHICEWEYALSESINLVTKTKLSFMTVTDEHERTSKTLKKDVLVHSYLMNVD